MVILALFVSMIPSALFFVFLVRSDPGRPEFGRRCRKALLYGVASTVPIILAALVLNILGNLAGMKNWPLVWRGLYKDYVLAAGVEEACKFMFLRILLKKADHDYTWYDVVAYMTLIGLGFGALEAVVYAFESGPVHVLVRGILIMHGGFGFIKGWFFGKSLLTGKKRFAVLATLIPFVIHGTYDFFLTPELLEINDNFAFIPVLLALASIVFMVIMLVFFFRKNKKEKYLAPVRPVMDNTGGLG